MGVQQPGIKTRFALVRWLRRPLRTVALAVLAVLLLPYLLTPLYAVVNPVSTVMLSRRLSGARVERHFVPLARISPALPLAVIIAEDGRFCSHHGVDFTEIREAISEADDIDEMRGGSTITQQVAKNLFLWPGRSFVRKALEFPLALWIDLVLPKRRVLEIYLNIAEWGPDGEFGVEAGAATGVRQIGARVVAAPRRRCWRRCCPIRSNAMPASPDRGCGGSVHSMQHGRRGRPGRPRAPAPPTSLGVYLPL